MNWLEQLDRIGTDYAEGIIGSGVAIRKLMDVCGLSFLEACEHLDGFPAPPASDEAAE